MSFMIVESWNVESIKKFWFFITNICRMKLRMIFELMNATIFLFRFWNLINNDVQICLSLIFFSIRIVRMWKIFNNFKKKFFLFETDIFIIFFFNNYNKSRSSNFVCFFDFLFFFIRKFFVQIGNCVKTIFDRIKFISFSFFEILIVRIFETFFGKINKFFFNIFNTENRFFNNFSFEHIDISSTQFFSNICVTTHLRCD